MFRALSSNFESERCMLWEGQCQSVACAGDSGTQLGTNISFFPKCRECGCVVRCLFGGGERGKKSRCRRRRRGRLVPRDARGIPRWCGPPRFRGTECGEARGDSLLLLLSRLNDSLSWDRGDHVVGSWKAFSTVCSAGARQDIVVLEPENRASLRSHRS
ncbi:uncharacterized protein KNAG_0B03880 [Huiozyma naganishii CBS 8797]|uniref:Uncharacterized protein n=1 Tax=Huiozyma naganishii (strain ATCC MYA-139 / BCRC 22969 / CBS 8797 / KCTC 17520 / NBRC 10181 / NCYC 3082 / Yp74L-3) TaxID=1071383 RepID=J7S3P1_HUIN7|nr:hypothetical protein KNAG_0B03880 [Kazachstania naganishii CBS 8797]CCK68829.1 hypothetical protein KNAG_0B03880 [Kazachstania naganishii CBS 8797]